MPTTRQRPGFTLVELISVLAILGILATLAVGQTRGAKERALAVALAADVAVFRDAALEAAGDVTGRSCPDPAGGAATVACKVQGADLLPYLKDGFATGTGSAVSHTNAGVTMEFVAADDPARVLVSGAADAKGPMLRLTANGPQAMRVLDALGRDLPPGSFLLQASVDVTGGVANSGFLDHLNDLYFREMAKYPTGSPEANAVKTEWNALGVAGARCMTGGSCAPHVSTAAGNAVVVLW